MRVSGRRLSRLELGLIAVALLVPVPLVVLNGYAAGLPGAVENGLGSLVTLGAEDEGSGIEGRGHAREDGNAERRSSRAALSISRRGTTPLARDESTSSGSSAGETASDSSDYDAGAGTSPEADAPDGTGDSGGSTSSGENGASSGEGAGSPAASGDSPGLALTTGGEGTTTGLSAGTSGVAVDVGSNTGDVGSGGAGTVTVEAADTQGSSSAVVVGVPATGSTVP